MQQRAAAVFDGQEAGTPNRDIAGGQFLLTFAWLSAVNLTINIPTEQSLSVNLVDDNWSLPSAHGVLNRLGVICGRLFINNEPRYKIN